MKKRMQKAFTFVVSMCVCLLSFTSVKALSTSSSTSILPKTTVRLRDSMQSCDESQTVPILIWATDIDQQSVERVAEKELGFSKDELISESLTLTAKDIASRAGDLGSNSFEQSVQQYIAATRADRKALQERVNRYIAARRSISKEAYTEANYDLIEELGIDESQVRFASAYSPMIIAELSPSQISDAEASANVLSIDLCEETDGIVAEEEEYTQQQNTRSSATEELDEMREAYGIETIYDAFGLNGDSVNVGIMEWKCVDTDDPELPSDRVVVVGNSVEGDHATNSARVCAGEHGVANGATVYSAGSQYYLDETTNEWVEYPYPEYIYRAIELLLDRNVTVINHSGSTSSVDGYDPYNKWMDHIASVHGVTFVVSAGNTYGNIPRPADAYNVITVGYFDGKRTSSVADDSLFPDSGYVSQNGVKKPDLVAPADYSNGGTSVAAPFVTGVVAMMMELQPALSLQPHVVKAILMASCQRKVISDPPEAMSTTETSLTLKQGAGAIDPVMALSIVSAGNYGFSEMAVQENLHEIHFEQPCYGSEGMTVALTWLHETIADENESSWIKQETAVVFSAKMENLTLTVNDGISSALENSSTEFVYITPSETDAAYCLKIQKEVPGTQTTEIRVPVRYAYAWAITNQQFQYRNTNYGLHYIKNESTNRYLGMENTNHTFVNSDVFDATSAYQWALCNATDGYQLVSGLGNGYSIGIGSVTGDTRVATLQNTTASPMSVVPNSNGTYSFVKTIDGMEYALSALSDTAVGWCGYNVAAENQQWRLENCNYQNGDINVDGTFNLQDAMLLMGHTNGDRVLSNRQLLFADVSGDGIVNMLDAARLYAFVNGQSVII